MQTRTVLAGIVTHLRVGQIMKGYKGINKDGEHRQLDGPHKKKAVDRRYRPQMDRVAAKS